MCNASACTFIKQLMSEMHCLPRGEYSDICWVHVTDSSNAQPLESYAKGSWEGESKDVFEK